MAGPKVSIIKRFHCIADRWHQLAVKTEATTLHGNSINSVIYTPIILVGYGAAAMQ